MAESADILTAPDQQVILPDLAAGCSMADMARLAPGRGRLGRAGRRPGIADAVVPVTYMNSTADIKAFCGRNGGAVCTSSNAEVALEWAFEQRPDAKVLFLPDQHLGRNTAVLKMGLTLDDCVVWDPHRPNGGLTAEQLRDAKMILWKGHCSVHGRFSADVVDDAARHASPASRSWCTPSARTRSCSRPTWSARPSSSSRPSRPRPAGSAWAIGTELNLVQAAGGRPPRQADRRSSTRPSATARR